MCLAIPGEVLDICGQDPLSASGRVRFGDVVKKVNLAFVPNVQVGDFVIVHVGFAISILDQKRAHEVLELLQDEIGAES